MEMTNGKELVKRVSHELGARAGFLRGLLPSGITPDRMKAFALDAIRRDQKLLECSLPSILGAVYECAKAGIEPNGIEAVIIPQTVKRMDNGRERWEKQATIRIMYRGAMSIAMRSGRVTNIWTGLIREHDEFEIVEGLVPRLEHVPAISGERGEILYAYACARFSDDFRQFRVVDRAEIARAKKASQTAGKGFSPWSSDEGAMWRKTAVHRLCKMLPLPSSAERILNVDESAEQDLGNAWDALGAEPDEDQGGGKVRGSTIGQGIPPEEGGLTESEAAALDDFAIDVMGDDQPGF